MLFSIETDEIPAPDSVQWPLLGITAGYTEGVSVSAYANISSLPPVRGRKTHASDKVKPARSIRKLSLCPRAIARPRPPLPHKKAEQHELDASVRACANGVGPWELPRSPARSEPHEALRTSDDEC